MAKGESVMAYFMRISNLRDQLSSIGKIVDENDLTMLALNGLPTSWESYIQGISARADLRMFDKLRVDYIQEESRLAARGVIKNTHEDNHVLAAQSFKKKGGYWKKNNFKRNRDQRSNPPHDSKKKKKDLSHIKCFRCDKFGHYARDYLSQPKQ